VSHGITNWLMLGNDQHSDCGAAMVEHARMAKAAVGINSDGSGQFPEGFALPTEEDTLTPYYAYGIDVLNEPPPTPDDGVENATWLKYLYDVTAGLAKKPASDDIVEWAYAEIDASDVNEIHQAMLDFHGVLVGCSLTDQAETEFSNHQPWTITAQEQPDPQMGHDILLVDFDTEGEDIITWAAKQRCTIAWETGEEGAGDLECWVFITEEDVANGALTPEQFAALKAEIASLGGTVSPDIPSPSSPPAPGPVDPPAPDPVIPPAPSPVTPPAPPVTPPPVPPPAPPPPSHQSWWADVLSWFEDMKRWYDEAQVWVAGNAGDSEVAP
jgi:hypothetical protein